MKKLFTLLCIGLLFTACAQQTKNETDMEFTDNVKEALADSGRVDLNSLQWTREPGGFEVKGDTILITTAPHTDLWQRTYYHFQNDNAPVLQMKTREKFFSFVVKTDFTQSHQRFDQCGIVMYLDSENWLKGSVEYENDEFQHLGSVATNKGYSDWATTAIPADVKTMWYRSPVARMTTASSAPPTASISVRCASATCMPVPTKSALASMPVLPKSHPSQQSSPI